VFPVISFTCSYIKKVMKKVKVFNYTFDLIQSVDTSLVGRLAEDSIGKVSD